MRSNLSTTSTGLSLIHLLQWSSSAAGSRAPRSHCSAHTGNVWNFLERDECGGRWAEARVQSTFSRINKELGKKHQSLNKNVNSTPVYFRAAADDVFNLLTWLIHFRIVWALRSQKTEKITTTGAKDDVFKYLVLTGQKSTTQRCSAYHDSHTLEKLETANIWQQKQKSFTWHHKTQLELRGLIY